MQGIFAAYALLAMHHQPHPAATDEPSAANNSATHSAIRTTVAHVWQGAGLPPVAPSALQLAGNGAEYRSSFAVDVVGPASVALSAMAAAQLAVLRQPQQARPTVQVDVPHALAETTGYFTLNGAQPNLWAPLSGLYPCGAALGQPGFVRIHANFDHHRDGVVRLLGLPTGHATPKEAVAQALQSFSAIDFEERAAQAGLVVAAVRTPAAWAVHPQAAAVLAEPLVRITQLDADQPAPPRPWPSGAAQAAPLAGLRVLDLARILAGPVAARTLAAHGAEVLMVNGPGLPNIEAIADVSRGKRSALLDLKSAAGLAQMQHLLADSHVLLQGYRPGSLQALGLGPQQAAALRPGLVYASLSAYGRSGPWAGRRGFDSLVQTATGINWAEAEAFGAAQPQALPMQILDYSAGFLLAFGIQAALWRQATQGGSWHVEVSLARVAQWLVQTGRSPVAPQQASASSLAQRAGPYLEHLASGFGALAAVRHSGQLVGVTPRWPHPSVPPGTDAPQWLPQRP